jgi:tRNA pseudouridine-54 N-methylase
MSSSPASACEAVTPSNTEDLPGGACRGLYIGGGGTVRLQSSTQKRTNVDFVGILSGTVLPVETVRVLASGTTATNIVALY